MPTYYEITIQGHLDPHWSNWFDGLSITHEPNGTTTLAGSIVDQTALHGVLIKVRDLGLPLIMIPLFFVSVMVIEGFFIGYLRLAIGSVWPASIAHSAHNVFWKMFAGLTVAFGPLVAEYLLGESGILTLAGYALVLGCVAYLVTKHSRAARTPAVQHI
jgi:hypothetical protein